MPDERTIKAFLHIQPAFRIPQERRMDHLASAYNDLERLKVLIREVIEPAASNFEVLNKFVLLKPNWVTHDRKVSDALCLRTNDHFLLAALDVILSMKPKRVLIGDAPIQGCDWGRMLSPSFLLEVDRLQQAYQIPVSIKDFRRRTFVPSHNHPTTELNPLSDYVITDLGKESFLEPITRGDRQMFRVTDYDPDRFTSSHAPGVHKYCLTKALYEADVVISLPKVKTHQKAGITAALKNIVGLNGDKDFLPHHRVGGTGFGGDCYPGRHPLRLAAERSLDFANRHQGTWRYTLGRRVAGALWRLSLPGKEHHLAAGWYGNDTTWRMVLDLNRIITHGLPDGTVSATPQRQLFSLSDGIIGGQGNGPLDPDPLPLGIVSFSNHSALNDVAMATLMGFDVDRIPLLRSALKDIPKHSVLTYGGISMNWQDLGRFAVMTEPPPGWVDHLNLQK